MEHIAINPPELFSGKAFSQTFSISTPQRLIFVSGQVDCDREGKVRNPDDLEAQLAGTLDNLKIALRAQGASMPLIAITASAESGAEMEATAVGFDAFLRKPLTGDALADTLREVFVRRAAA